MKKNILKILFISFIFLIMSSITILADGMCEDINLSSTDEKIIVNKADDCVEIEQLSYKHSGYSMNTYIIGEKLSAEGYTLSYADENKEDTPLEYFTGGYVKAVNNNEPSNIYYIPIKMRKTEENLINLSNFYFNDQGGSSVSSKAGIGGKSQEDLSYVMTPPSGGSSKMEGVSVSTQYAGAGNTTSWTIEMNIYAEGNTIFFANGRYLSDAMRTVFKWEPNGDIEVSDNGTMKVVGNIKRNQWHKLALSYSSTRKRVIVFIDGKLISKETAPYWTDISMFVFGTYPGSSDGFCALDDGKSYIGYYYENYYNSANLTAQNDTVSVEDNVIWTDFEANDTFQSLKNSLLCENEIGIVGEYGANSEILVLNNTDYSYFTIKNGLFADVDFKRESSNIEVNATVTNKLPTQKNGTMILCLKNQDGSTNKVIATDTLDILSLGTEFYIGPCEADSLSAEAIFITDWTDRLPLITKVFKENVE